MGDMEPLKDKPAHELLIVVQGVAPTREMAEELTITGTRQLFYARLPDVKGTAGGVSFVFDEVLPASPGYRWTLNHTMAVDDPLELFRPIAKWSVHRSWRTHDGHEKTLRTRQDDPVEERRH